MEYDIFENFVGLLIKTHLFELFKLKRQPYFFL